MKYFKILFPVALAGLFSLQVTAQKAPVFKITSFRYDFGKIQEGDGRVTHNFPVENPGNDTLRVLKIKSSAENISGAFTPYKIAPGGKGEITLTFDPSNEKGRVEKMVSVRTNDPQNPVRQFGIIAEVIPSEKKVVDQYPVISGNLRLKSRHVTMDKLLKTMTRTDTFKIYNNWDKTMTLAMKPFPDRTFWKVIPTELKPGQEGFIIVTYDASKSTVYGPELEQFLVETNDTLEPLKYLTLGINILEDFSYLKGKPEQRPKVHFDATTYNFGEIKEGSVVEHSYIIENHGKGDLIIHRTKASCGCTVAELEKTIIKPGEQTFLKVKFDSHGMSGFMSKAVTFICNDPDNPVTMLNFTVDIKK
jgi:hypothetical protein